MIPAQNLVVFLLISKLNQFLLIWGCRFLHSAGPLFLEIKLYYFTKESWLEFWCVITYIGVIFGRQVSYTVYYWTIQTLALSKTGKAPGSESINVIVYAWFLDYKKTFGNVKHDKLQKILCQLELDWRYNKSRQLNYF